jgi:F0F1-type ATP synthase membrane subunit c/vacuolar-type H+-ATPase subunit K
MKRVLTLILVTALLAVMLALAGPASAQGCADFGQHTSSEAKDPEFRPLGQTLIYFFGTGPRSGLVHEEQSSFCS